MSSSIENFEWLIGEEGWAERPASAAASYRFSQAVLSANERRIIFALLRGGLFCIIAAVLASGTFKTHKEFSQFQHAPAPLSGGGFPRCTGIGRP